MIFAWNFSKIIDKVYNRKRHGIFILANQAFDFRRPCKGFPKMLTKEFLAIDLVNHLNELSEDSEKVKKHIERQLNQFNYKRIKRIAKK